MCGIIDGLAEMAAYRNHGTRTRLEQPRYDFGSHECLVFTVIIQKISGPGVEMHVHPRIRRFRPFSAFFTLCAVKAPFNDATRGKRQISKLIKGD